MVKNSMGNRISDLRKEKSLTQAQLAEQMGVTDKAVSKWERDVSCPDIGSIGKLAEVLGVSVETLMQGGKPVSGEKPQWQQTLGLVLTAVPLAMGVAVAALSVMEKLDGKSAMFMLGLGLACLALNKLREQGD